MVAYADSSALVKLAHRERHSEALIGWLESRSDIVLVSSVLAEVELLRALQRYDSAALPQVPAVLARLVRIEISSTVRAIAGAFQHEMLRTLDAIHLATTRYLVTAGMNIDWFVGYDARLLAFAEAEALRVVSPGIG